MKFNKFIRERLGGLRLLNISTESYLPGLVLEKKNLRSIGHIKDVLPNASLDWGIKKSEGNLVYGSVSGTKNFGSGIRLMGLIGLSGGISKEFQADYSVSDVKGAEFANISQLSIMPYLFELRKKDKRQWRQLNGKLLVTESFFACKFSMQFKHKGKAITKAELEKITKININADVNADWQNDYDLVITNNCKVPFGVRGFIV